MRSVRYALQVNDTVQITQDKAITLTTGVKAAKDTLFFLNQDDVESDTKPPKIPSKKPPSKKANGNASPVKNKMAGGKVLRNKTRGSAHDEAMQSTMAKIKEHQRELHLKLQDDGMAKYSETGGESGGKEGKGWKRFQSYKGEAGLPKEVENLRVRHCSIPLSSIVLDGLCFRYSLTERRKPLFCLYMDLPFHSISIRSRM